MPEGADQTQPGVPQTYPWSRGCGYVPSEHKGTEGVRWALKENGVLLAEDRMLQEQKFTLQSLSH